MIASDGCLAKLPRKVIQDVKKGEWLTQCPRRREGGVRSIKFIGRDALSELNNVVLVTKVNNED